MLNKLCLAVLFLVPPLWVAGQSVNFERGVTIKNKTKDHYYKMVDWDEGQYEEFAHWNETEHGSIIEFLNWRALFPPDYNKEGNTKYPMIVMLHGAGESGRKYSNIYDYAPTDPEYDNNSHQLRFGGQEHMEATMKPASDPGAFPGIVVFPQSSYNAAWNDTEINMLIAVLEFMIAEYNADPDKIAIHGLSNGAKGSWKIATWRPDLFAAILTMSGVGTDLETMTDSLATTPVWIFQGSNDSNPSASWSKEWSDKIIAKGGEARYTLYNDQGHSIWNNAYSEPDFFSWIMAADKKDIRFMGGEPDPSCNLTSENAVRLGFSAGYLAYQWYRDGIPVEGATGRYFSPTANGTYTVKFKRVTNFAWAESNPVDIFYTSPGFSQQKAALTPSGSTHLPIPYSEGIDQTLNLQTTAGYSSYNWYKNGVLLGTSESNLYNLNDEAGEKFTAEDAGAYTVLVTDKNGCSTLMSDPVNVTWTQDGGGGSGAPPEVVEKVIVSSDEIEVNWTDIEGETSYEVWRARSNTLSQDGDKFTGYPGRQYQHVATLPANTVSFTDSGLRPGASYNYRIRAILAESSVFSEEEESFVTTQDDNSAPTEPLNLAVAHTTESEIYLQWEPSTDDDVVFRYEIFLDGEKIADVLSEPDDDDPTDGSPAPATSFVVTGDLKFRTTYEFKVRAVDYQGGNFEGNTSAFSNTVASKLVTSVASEEVQQEKPVAYPNPFQNQVIVRLPGKQSQGLPIVIYDQAGRLIKTAGITGAGDEVMVDLGDINDGYYILSVGPYQFRVIKKN